MIKKRSRDKGGGDNQENKNSHKKQILPSPIPKKRLCNIAVTKDVQQQLNQQHQSALSLLDYVKLEYKENMGLQHLSNTRSRSTSTNNGNDHDDQEEEVDDKGIDSWIANKCDSFLNAYLKPTQERIDSYYGTPELVNSVRENNFVKVKQLHENKQITCNACNPFGESILHVACRRGHYQMITFLIDTVGLGLSTLQVRDDFHRTPLHDTFWSSSKYKFQIVDYFLRHDDASQNNVVELLFVKDKRGFTPLDYARKDEHQRWFHFLQQRKNLLRSCSNSNSNNSDKNTTTTATLSSSSSLSSVSSSNSLLSLPEPMPILTPINMKYSIQKTTSIQRG